MQLGRLRSVSWRDPPSRRPVEIYGDVRSEVVDGHIRVLTVRAEKKNAFTPKISTELAAALTRLDDDPELWVGVLPSRARTLC